MGMLIPLSWLCSCLLSAERWESHTALSRTNLVLEEFAEGRPLLALLSLLLTLMTEALCLSLLKPSRPTTTRGLRRSENTGEVVPLAQNPQPRLPRSRRPRLRKPP